MNKKDFRIIFMGTPDFSACCLKALIDSGFNVVLVMSQPDKPVGRKHIITPPPAKVCALENNIPVYQPDSLKTDEAYETMAGYEPDLIITAAYGKILPVRILELSKVKAINVHASLLPERRGSAPVQRAIMEGDKVTGVTIMQMEEGMDTGDMISRVEVPIDINIHTDELMELLAVKGSELLSDTLEDYCDGKIDPVKQDEALVTVCPPIRAEEGEFSWDMNALDIHNKVRALSSWPGALTSLDGKKVKIYDSEYIESFEADDSLPAGAVVKAHKKDLIVKCGEGFLKINILQTEGGKKLSAADCAHNFKVGQVFGN